MGFPFFLSERSCIRWINANQLLPYLDYDLIAQNPKIICGYSDITILENAIYAKTGLVTYSGPHYCTFGFDGEPEYTRKAFFDCLIEESQKTIKRHSKISLSLLILFGVQMILYFVLPNFLPGDVNAFIIMLTLSGLTSILVGLTKSKLKWFFPLSVSLVFFFINLFYLTDEKFLGFIVSLYFAAGSLIVIAIVSLLVYLYQKFKHR